MSAFSSRTMRASDWSKLKHFEAKEFRSPDKMGYEFMLWLDQVRDIAGVPMHVTSSYRSPAYNKRVGGAADSAHCDVPCNAVDIGKRPTKADPHWNYARWRIVNAAIVCGCTRIGLYPNGSLHLDRTQDARPGQRLWVMVDNPSR